jgi:hypothetical protein
MRSKDDVTAYLRDALEAIDRAAIPEPLQPVALAKAIELLAGTASSDAVERPAPASPDVSPPARGAGTPEDRVGAALGISSEAVAYVFAFDGDTVALTIPRERLVEDRVGAQRQVALLVCAARQLGGLEERTHSDRIRTAGVDLGVVRKNTFREEIGRLGPSFVSQPSGRFGRTLRLTQPGRREAGDLIRALAPELA